MPKWLTILGGLFLLFLAGVFYLRQSQSPKASRLFPMPESPTRLDIQGPRGTFVFEKTSGQWSLREPVTFPADLDILNYLLNTLSSVELGESLTQRPETHDRYEITDSSGVTLKIYSQTKAEPITLVVGKMAPDSAHIYLRLPPEPTVYLGTGLRRYDCEKNLDEWRDHYLLRVSSTRAIVGVGFEGKTVKREFRKSTDTWTVNEKTADPAKVDQMISRLTSIYVSRFIDPPQSLDVKKWGLRPPGQKMVISFSDGSNAEFRLGHRDEKSQENVVQRMGDPILYSVPFYYFKELNKPVDFFISTATPAAKP